MLMYMNMLLVLLCATAVVGISRSKRQTLGYYLCGGSSNGCSNFNGGCGSNCGVSNSFVLPNSFYSFNSNCQTPCNNINCNQYNGQYTNGQYIATIIGGSQYNSCANTCCGGVNSLNNWPTFGSSVTYSGFNNGYYNSYANNALGNGFNNYNNNNYINTNPLTQVGPGPVVISNGVRRSPVPAAFTGTVSNGVLLCGGSEPAGGSCAGNGLCPTGHLCVAGNICCRCAVGVSAGTCPSGNDFECPVGYGCATSLNCCPTEVKTGQGLSVCVNGDCQDGFECGKGNLCYPIG